MKQRRIIHASTQQTLDGKTLVITRLQYNQYTLLFKSRHDAALFLSALRRAL